MSKGRNAGRIYPTVRLLIKSSRRVVGLDELQLPGEIARYGRCSNKWVVDIYRAPLLPHQSSTSHHSLSTTYHRAISRVHGDRTRIDHGVSGPTTYIASDIPNHTPDILVSLRSNCYIELPPCRILRPATMADTITASSPLARVMPPSLSQLILVRGHSPLTRP